VLVGILIDVEHDWVVVLAKEELFPLVSFFLEQFNELFFLLGISSLVLVDE
jgi:hypothetical protein